MAARFESYQIYLWWVSYVIKKITLLKPEVIEFAYIILLQANWNVCFIMLIIDKMWFQIAHQDQKPWWDVQNLFASFKFQFGYIWKYHVSMNLSVKKY